MAMNIAAAGVKSALLGSKSAEIFYCAALFHSTPHLDRNRRNNWNWSCSSSYYPKRTKKLHLKQSKLCNVSAYAEHCFQSWKSGSDEEEPSYWFREWYGTTGPRRGRTNNKRPKFGGRRGFQFVDEEVDIESLFRGTFGRSKSFSWSFTADEFPQRGRGSLGFESNQNRRSWRWKTRWEDEDTSGHRTSWKSRYREKYDSSTESDSADSSSSPDRVTLGLSASGPLKLEEVKSAYRQCAMKWHPDRHQGSSKAAAEENFKKCSAAYESLCSKMDAA